MSEPHPRTISIYVTAFPISDRTTSHNGVLEADILARCPHCASDLLEVSNTHTACHTVQCLVCHSEITGTSFQGSFRSWNGCVRSHARALADVLYRWNMRGGLPARSLSDYRSETEKIFSGLLVARKSKSSVGKKARSVR
jgi:hypothetical protein